MDKRERQCILLVEDDHFIREIVQTLLETEGYKVITANNGQEALDQLSSSPRPCLILLDLMMPVMNGIEFLERLRGHGNNEVAMIPVIVTSAIEDDTGTTSRLASKVLNKPIELEVLLRVVEERCGSPGFRVDQ